jgi:hypothetical protein
MPLGLRRRPYADIIRAEAPAAYSAYQARLDRDRSRRTAAAQSSLAQRELGLRQQQLEDSANQFNESLGLSQNQFNQTLAEQQRQSEANAALQDEQMQQAQQQGNIATGLSLGALGLEAYPYLAGSTASTVAPTAGATAAGGSAALTGTSGTAALAPSGAASSSGGLGAAGTAGIVAGAILGQHALSNATDREINGVQTSDFFNRSDEGSWRPHAFTEPWMAWAEQNWGRPTGGERLDAAIENGDAGNIVANIPAAANQWANPIGSFGYDALHAGVSSALGTNDTLTDVLLSPLDPISAGSNLFSNISSWF